MTSSERVLTQGRPRRRWHLFRTARLNGVGRAALVAASLVPAALGAVTAKLAGGQAWIGACVGLPLVVLVLLVLDRRRSRLSLVGFGWTDDLAEVEAAAEELRRRGVEVLTQRDPPSLTIRRRDKRMLVEVLGLTSGRLPPL